MSRIVTYGHRNVIWVGAARDRADFAPRDITRVSSFLAEEAAAGKVSMREVCKGGQGGWSRARAVHP
jgi:hypothetical protein